MTAGMLIVGAGECGGRAALTLRERGYDGPVTLVGDELHLPMTAAAVQDAMVSEVGPPKLVSDREYFASRRIECVTGTSAAIDRAAQRVAPADGRTVL
jgi:3-phenylpropionate/trans-cinnamate dioxygenase ferredoxin reductase subunit